MLEKHYAAGLWPRRGICTGRALAAVLVLMTTQMQSAQAQAGGDMLDLLVQENRVFAASRYTQTMAETPANITVLTREDIRNFGYRNINEALSSIAGTYNAASQWPALGVRGVAVPGDFGSRVLYMVNGMPIYEPTYGGFFLEYIDIESIDRIEFIKGTGSSLYGSGAVQGVVNVITRSGHDAPGKTVSVEAASHNSAKLYGSRGRHDSNGVDSFVSVSAASSDGRDIYLREFDNANFNSAQFGGVSSGNDSHRNLRLFGRLATGDVWVQGLLISGRKQDPLASYNTVLDGRLELREFLGALETGFNRDLTDGAELTARAYYFNIAEKGEYPYGASPSATNSRGMPAEFINVSDLSSNQTGLEARYDRFLSNNHHLLVGAEIKQVRARHQIGDQPGLARVGVIATDTRNSYAQWAVFAQDELRLSPTSTLFLGGRLDAYESFSDGVTSRVSPRIAYVHQLSPRTTGKLIYGEAYRAPTLYESLYQDGAPPETIWANPDLKPELTRSLEALIEHDAARGLKWRLSGFINQLYDTPIQVVTPRFNGVDCKFGSNSCIQYRNSDTKQQVVGLEASVRYRQSKYGNLYGSVVLQRSRHDGGVLASSPRYQLKAGISQALPWSNMDAALETHYTGPVQGRFDTTLGRRTAEVPGYLMVNATINAARLAYGWRASLRINNLLDQNYYTVASRELQPLERVPAAGRLISLQLQLDF